MSTFDESFGTHFASNIDKIEEKRVRGKSKILNKSLRKRCLRAGAGTGQGEFSERLEGLMGFLKPKLGSV